MTKRRYPESVRAEARALHDEGHSYHEIARRLGLSGHGVVMKWLNPERAREWARKSEAKPERKEQKRAWERSERAKGRCADCNGVTSRYDRHRCLPCEFERRQENRHVVQRMWLGGRSLIEIAEALNTTVPSVGVCISKMRQQGWDMPYRYAAYDEKKAA